jgi:DNA-binding transcriptional regulator YiaG
MDYYPPGFPQECIDAVELARLKARKPVSAALGTGGFEDAVKESVAVIFSAFGQQACALVRKRTWTLDFARRETDLFLHHLIRYEYRQNFQGRIGSSSLSNVEFFSPDTDARVRRSERWRKYEKSLITAVRERDFPARGKAAPLGETLKTLRNEAKFTAEELAERMDITVRSVRRHEAGGTSDSDMSASTRKCSAAP